VELKRILDDFGIVFATLITLVLVPSLYLIVGDLHRLLGPREFSAPEINPDEMFIHESSPS
jgi:hypothetical protein